MTLQRTIELLTRTAIGMDTSKLFPTFHLDDRVLDIPEDIKKVIKSLPKPEIGKYWKNEYKLCIVIPSSFQLISTFKWEEESLEYLANLDLGIELIFTVFTYQGRAFYNNQTLWGLDQTNLMKFIGLLQTYEKNKMTERNNGRLFTEDMIMRCIENPVVIDLRGSTCTKEMIEEASKGYRDIDVSMEVKTEGPSASEVMENVKSELSNLLGPGKSDQTVVNSTSETDSSDQTECGQTKG